jgi:hypothetical protein
LRAEVHGGRSPIFREEPGPESLADDIRRLFVSKVDGATMAPLDEGRSVG